MVELTGNSESFGVISHGFNNWVFLVPAVVTIPLIVFFGYKLVQGMLDKEKKREEKRKRKEESKKGPTSKKVK